ncbi:MAG: hypothetical protein ACTSR3_01005 [Candidatus Helarchaeota archaeon]
MIYLRIIFEFDITDIFIKKTINGECRLYPTTFNVKMMIMVGERYDGWNS